MPWGASRELLAAFSLFHVTFRMFRLVQVLLNGVVDTWEDAKAFGSETLALKPQGHLHAWSQKFRPPSAAILMAAHRLDRVLVRKELQHPPPVRVAAERTRDPSSHGRGAAATLDVSAFPSGRAHCTRVSNCFRASGVLSLVLVRTSCVAAELLSDVRARCSSVCRRSEVPADRESRTGESGPCVRCHTASSSVAILLCRACAGRSRNDHESAMTTQKNTTRSRVLWRTVSLP